jgi:protein-(glutamine-N5) methyltransferase, release factor-specific
MTYKWFIDETEWQLNHLYGSAEGRAIAVRLLQHFCGTSSYEHLVEPYGAIAEEYFTPLQSAVQQLTAARPLQYIIGVQEFLGREFFVEEGVLIPRPETEELVLWVLEYVKQKGCAEKYKSGECENSLGENSIINEGQKITIIDACCGSGAIAVSLAASLPSAEIYAFDLSEKALEVTRRNCQLLLTDPSQVNTFKFDLLSIGDNKFDEKHSEIRSDSDNKDSSYGDKLAFYGGTPLTNNNMQQICGQADIIVSNPPYVTNSEKASMRKNVLDYEPEEALFVSDDDPLIFYKTLKRFTGQHLKPGGAIFLEVNERFGSEAAAIFKEAGYTNVETRQDIFGKDRMVMAVNA